MEISQEALEAVAAKATLEVGKALSVFAGQEVSARVAIADSMPLVDCASAISTVDGNAIVAHSQVIEGIHGVSFLIMTREDALTLVDILQKQPRGTTGILKEFDRSAIKETLNILSNTFLNELSRQIGETVAPAAPSLVTSARVQDVIKRSLQNTGDSAVVFGTTLTIAEQDLSTQLYLFFDEELVTLLKDS